MHEEIKLQYQLNKTLPDKIKIIESIFTKSGEIQNVFNRKILDAINVYNNNPTKIVSELEKKFEDHVPKNLTEKIFNLIFSKFYKNKTVIGPNY